MMREEVERALLNWALWRGSGGWFLIRCPIDVDPDEVRSRPPDDLDMPAREATVPVLSGWAIDVDNIVQGLPANHRHALWAYYLRRGPSGESITILVTTEQQADWLGCSPRAYDDWLAKGRKAVGDGLDAREWRIREARKAWAAAA